MGRWPAQIDQQLVPVYRLVGASLALAAIWTGSSVILESYTVLGVGTTIGRALFFNLECQTSIRRCSALGATKQLAVFDLACTFPCKVLIARFLGPEIPFIAGVVPNEEELRIYCPHLAALVITTLLFTF